MTVLKSIAVVVVMTFLLAVVLPVDHQKQPTKNGGPYYYSSFKTKTLPEVPIGEISEAEALRDAGNREYYRAYFNGNGRVTKLDKYVAGMVLWSSEYAYSLDGKVTHGRYYDSSGEEVEYIFDTEEAIASTVRRSKIPEGRAITDGKTKSHN